MASSIQQLLSDLVEAQLLSAADARLIEQRVTGETTTEEILNQLVADGQLSQYQAEQIGQGNLRGLCWGDYTLIRLLGVGGMGQVYLGRHRHLKRQVAIKVLPAGNPDSAATVERFKREMEVLAQLEHPNIVLALDAGELNGRPFLVMQYVDGEDLGTVVRSSGWLSVEAAVSAILQAARGIQHAHEQGVIHRDLKPSNLLRDRRGTIKVLDMGLARYASATQRIETVNELTGSGQIMGTVDYMAPEQAEDTRCADERSDIYSLGCTLYSLLNGQPMYEAESVVKKILAHRERPAPSLRMQRQDVPPELDAIYQKMVAKRPEDRFANMQQVVVALEGCPLPVAAAEANDGTFSTGQAAAGGPPISQQPTLTATPQSRAALAATSETIAFNKQQDTATSHGVPRTSRRRRHKRRSSGWVRWVSAGMVLLTIGAAAIGAGLWDARFDYLHVRERLGFAPVVGPSVEKPVGNTAAKLSGFTHRQRIQAHASPIHGLAVSPDGNNVASVAEELKFWDARTQTMLRRAKADGIRQLAYAPDGAALAGTGSMGARILDPVLGTVRSNLAQSLGIVSRVAYSPDGQFLAAAGRQLSLWGVETKKVSKTFSQSLEGTTALVFSPDGKFLITGHQDGTIIRWNVIDSAAAEQQKGDGTAIRSLSLSPAGTYLAVGKDRGAVDLWRVADWTTVGRFVGHVGPVTGVQFIDHPQRLVSAGHDGTIRVWDVFTQAELGRLLFQGQGFSGLALSAQGRVLAAASSDGGVDIWDLQADSQ